VSFWDERATTYVAEILSRFGDAGDVALEAFVGHGNLPASEDVERFRRADAVDLQALAALLDDRRHCHYVKVLVIAVQNLPHDLFLPFLRAGVRTIDPSCNRQFIFPCVLLRGARPVMAELIRIASQGSDTDIIGVVRAMYWLGVPPRYMFMGGEWPTADPAGGEAIDDLAGEFSRWALMEFLRNPNVDVQRVLVDRLPARTKLAPDEFRGAYDIATGHPHHYIRGRCAAQLARWMTPSRTPG
jgi:hypothetical protein